MTDGVLVAFGLPPVRLLGSANWHYAYFAITGNPRSPRRFRTEVLRAWRYAPSRRGNRSRTYWSRFSALLLRPPSPRRESSMSGAAPEARRTTLPRSRMRESRTSGPVKRAPGDRRLSSTKPVHPRVRPGEPRYGARRQQEPKALPASHPNRSAMLGGPSPPCPPARNSPAKTALPPRSRVPDFTQYPGQISGGAVRSGRPFPVRARGHSRVRPCSRAARAPDLEAGGRRDPAHGLPVRRAGPPGRGPRQPVRPRRRCSAR